MSGERRWSDDNAYDLVQAVRPSMLTPRDGRRSTGSSEPAVQEPGGVTVFLDDTYVGGLDALKSIPTRSIISVRRLTPIDATTRYGTGMTAGAILITTSVPR